MKLHVHITGPSAIRVEGEDLREMHDQLLEAIRGSASPWLTIAAPDGSLHTFNRDNLMMLVLQQSEASHVTNLN